MADQRDVDASSPWVVYETAEGKEFFQNEVTGETSWEIPPGFVDDAPVKVSSEADDEGISRPTNAVLLHRVTYNEEKARYENVPDELA